ncbi:YciI family protein [Kiloniella laminariae]|uniref:YciI family protein n=1 Tax=Kiloniella laminariae TaxID=454162 RepID=A0ABT4LL55_9PROT|nr:YciI family protein [Kiloniella laminariae]MCZ4281086.1 YciI family protein [Kiloniella laminariae]
MKFIFSCVDKKDHAHIRAENRPAHLEYLGKFMDRVVVAGPTLGADGESMTGSLLILEFDDAIAAQEFAENDPYKLAGLFEQVTITPWKQVLPK